MFKKGGFTRTQKYPYTHQINSLKTQKSLTSGQLQIFDNIIHLQTTFQAKNILNLRKVKFKTQMARTVTQKYMFTIMGFMIIAGAFNAIGTKMDNPAFKFQNKQYVWEGVYYKQFFHPYMQATTMFFGQFLSLLLFWYVRSKNPMKFQKRRQRAKEQGKIIGINKWLIAIPAFADFITATLHFTALNFIPGSVYQMMRASTVITTMLFSILFLDRKLRRHQVFGCTVVMLGVLIVAFSSLIFSKYHTEYKIDVTLQAIGYVLVLGLAFSNAFIFVFEEILMDKYYIQPLELVGYQGLFGLIFELICLPIISHLPCKFGIEACVFTREARPFLEVPSAYFTEIFASKVLIFFVLIGIFSISLSNVAGVNVTKHISALTRSICDVTRVVIIWTVANIITVTLGREYPNYRWELVTFKSIAVEFLGLMILVLGNLIYNGFVKIPGFYKTTLSLDLQEEKQIELKTDKEIYEDDLTLIV